MSDLTNDSLPSKVPTPSAFELVNISPEQVNAGEIDLELPALNPLLQHTNVGDIDSDAYPVFNKAFVLVLLI